MYSEPKLFLIITPYNNTFLLVKILIIFSINVYICVCVARESSHRIRVGAIAFIEFLLLSK